MVEDWLALPGDDLRPPMPTVSATALAVVKQRDEAREAYAKAWASLRPRQKVYLRALQQTGFSQARALKILAEVPEEYGGRKLARNAPGRWARTNESYVLVLAAMKAEAAVRVASRDDLLLRAHRIAEQAEAGEPVYGVDRENGGEKIIGHEKKLDTALRANEQLMKATKVLGAEDNRVQVAVGPALIVQVVQGDGSLKDVTPRGVTIDLPRPPSPP